MIYNKKRYFLSELCEIKYGKDHKHLPDGNFPVYGSGGIMRYVDSYLYDGESILIPRKGTLSSLYYVNEKFWTIDTLFWTKINEEIIFPKYLYYKLKIIDFNSMNIGSAVPSLSVDILNRIKLFVHDIYMQKHISNILSSFDDKIDLNNKINQNLEELAQILYKNWFVEFEFPNENGKPYKSSGGKMVDSELGLIPKGWTVEKLVKYLNFQRGLEPGSKNYEEEKTKENIPFYRVGDLIDRTKIKYIKTELAKDSLVNKDDVLVSFDGALGRVTTGVSGSYSTGMRKITSKNDFLSKEFIYILFKSNDIQNTIEQYANGTTILHASSSIKHLTIPYKEETVRKFDESVSPIVKMIRNLQYENEKLTEIRDSLLPKLMSGEIKVPIEGE